MKNKDSPQNKFGVSVKENIYKKYTGKYYIISPIGTNERYVGLVKEINSSKGKITLNPYFGSKYSKKSRKNLYTLINEDFDMFVNLSEITFDPTTKESIQYNCSLSNKGIIKAEKEKLNSDKQKKRKDRLK